MSSENYSIHHNARLASIAGNYAAGTCLVKTTDGDYVIATAANRTLYGRRSAGVMRTAGDGTRNRSVDFQFCGLLAAGVAAGAADDYVRVSATGFLERVTTPALTDDVVGTCDADGNCYLLFGMPEFVELPSGMSPSDLFYWNGTALVRIAIGAESSEFKVVGGVPAWVAGFDPNQLGLTGYWRNYAGDPWTSTASAGTSGGRTLTAGAAPTVGANFGTHPSADFNGAGHYLVGGGGLKLSDLLSRPGYFVQVVFQADTAAAPGAAPYNDRQLFTENGGNFYIGFSTSGIRAGHYDDVSFKATPYIACATGQKHCVQVWYDGVNIYCRVNGSVPQVVAAGQVTVAITALIPRVGATFDLVSYFDGRIAQIITAASPLSGTQRDQLLADAQTGYGTL